MLDFPFGSEQRGAQEKIASRSEKKLKTELKVVAASGGCSSSIKGMLDVVYKSRAKTYQEKRFDTCGTHIRKHNQKSVGRRSGKENAVASKTC